jgi:ABC-type polar amino acid transport system ATPase subunit
MEVTMIDIAGLVKDYTGDDGPVRVLDGVTVAIKKGEVTVFLGGTGSGKSTLLRCINGLEEFQAGRVRVADLELCPGRCPGPRLQALRRRVGMVFQDYNLFANMNVLDNVLAGPIHAQGRKRAEAEPEAMALLEQVGMAAKAKARVEELSGGQKQRVAIARALAVRPEAILFDEPTAALDPKMKGEVLDVIDRLAETGQTMVLVTHDVDFVRCMADTVHFMAAGTIAESGTAEAVLKNPRQESTQAFLRKKGEEEG